MSSTIENIVTIIERYVKGSTPEQISYILCYSGEFFYALEVKETQRIAASNLNQLLGQLVSTFPEYLPPSLTKTEHISITKSAILLHYQKAWMASHDMTNPENLTAYFPFRNMVEKLVEEFLPKSLWKEVGKKYSGFTNEIATMAGKYVTNSDLEGVSIKMNSTGLTVIPPEYEKFLQDLSTVFIEELK